MKTSWYFSACIGVVILSLTIFEAGGQPTTAEPMVKVAVPLDAMVGPEKKGRNMGGGNPLAGMMGMLEMPLGLAKTFIGMIPGASMIAGMIPGLGGMFGGGGGGMGGGMGGGGGGQMMQQGGGGQMQQDMGGQQQQMGR